MLASVGVGTASLQNGAPAEALFASPAPLRLRLQAPLSQLFAARKDPNAEVAGSLAYTDEAGREVVLEQVAVSLRGHTSLDPAECSFPKLKVRFTPGEALDASIFRGTRAVKIGTHCGEGSPVKRTPKGRLAHEVSPHREALAYRLLAALGVATLRARPAEIAYVDGASATARKAMLLEDTSDAIRRLGGDREIPKQQFSHAREMFGAADGARLAFGQALIGNFDWCVKWTADDTYRCDARQILWNVSAIGRAQGPAIPLMYDFDVAGIVSGGHGWFPRVFTDGFGPSKSRPEIEATAQTQRARSLFTRAELDAARRGFLERKSAGYQALDAAVVDPDGRSIARAYLDGFFNAIEADAAFYRTAVTVPNTVAFTDAEGTRQACDVPVAVGTPVDALKSTGGGLIQVWVLDALWRWSMNRRCDAMRAGPVWISRHAIEANYPAR